MRELKEKDIQKQVMDWLEWRGHLVVKINNVGIRKENGSFIPPRQRGISDLLVCEKKTGRFCAIEVKRANGQLTIWQQNFLKDVEQRGGRAIVARNLNDIINNFKF